VVDDPLDGPEGRLSKAERKATLTQQLLADDALSASRKRRFSRMQEEGQARAAKGKRRKTDNPRNKPSKQRPKH
jgi:phage portal protein BeeE